MSALKNFLLILIIHLGVINAVFAQKDTTSWKKLNTVPYHGKQDDIYFINESIGWYVNGDGKIYKTHNGGKYWKEIYSKPGTYFRCVGFIDSLVGFAGNIGTDYFPDVTDTVPLYKTTDGGLTWNPIKYKGPVIKGLCAIDILKQPFINAGNLDYKYLIHAAGRVGGPAFMLTSADKGTTWVSTDMNANTVFILDIHFFNRSDGVMCGASDTSLEKSHAIILTTKDGGKTWIPRYESKRPYEITWKQSFPTRQTGYVTVQSYDPDSTNTQRYVAKTIDGGKTWKEIKLTNNHECTEFGVGFVNEKFGWVGGKKDSYETYDGGKTWTNVQMGYAVNKIRILKNKKKVTAYAIGKFVYKYQSF